MNDLIDPLELVGTRVGEKYLVSEIVAQTGLSVVYRATHILWKRSVALKIFDGASGLLPEERAATLTNFVREGALLGELSEACSAVCQARDIGSLTTATGKWMPYMVLEWLEGESLERTLSRDRQRGAPPRTIREVMRLLGPIADALGCAHTRGIAHCDVKPGNIMLRPPAGDGPPCKLLDFGIAKVAGALETESAVVDRAFTPGYAAPEQFDPAYGETGPWTDVFALALVVVEMVTGREALRGQQQFKLAVQSCDPEHRPTPRQLGVSIGQEVESVLERALAVKPAERFKDAGEFWSELSRAVTRSELEGTKPLVPTRVRRSSLPLSSALSPRTPRGSRVLAAAFAVAMGIVVALGCAGHLASRSAPVSSSPALQAFAP
jgi:serine/threonine protein kinase